MTADYGRPEIDRSDWWDRLWQPFWVLPAAVAVGSVLLGALLPHADERLAGWIPYVFESGADGARQLLGTIASAMISVTGLVFSITMVVLQLASSQFSPRLLGEFLQSRIVQLTLGVFAGSFLYSLTVLRLVRGSSGQAAQFVPQASVTVAFVYVIASVAFFLAFIHHITQSIRVSEVVSSIGDRTRDAAELLYDGERPVATWSPAPGTDRRSLECAHGRGYVTTIDSSGLVGWAAEHDCVVVLEIGLGDFVVEGEQVGHVWGFTNADQKLDKVATRIHLDRERQLGPDFAFGLRQLTDIADRALSPGVNDPTTAIQVIDEIYAVLRHMAGRPDLAPVLVDEEGVVRGIYRATTLEDALGFLVEIAHYASDSPRVQERIREVLTGLRDAVLPEHRSLVERIGAVIKATGTEY